MIFEVLVFALYAAAYDNGAGELPAMGWSTWCTDDACGVLDYCEEKLVRESADALVAQGLDKLGYKTIHLDDCWSATNRTPSGELQPNAALFPSSEETKSLKPLADYIHSLGLRLGVYTCIGTKTCKHARPGSFGNYEKDANTLASWGIDMVKADNCNKPGGFSERELFSNFSRALNATGRPILFSLCEWGEESVESWGGQVSQMFRVQMDHLPFFTFFNGTAAGAGFGSGTKEIIEYVATLKPSTFARRSAWPDPDFLMTLFPFTQSFEDSKTEFSFWSLWSAPLIVATDMRRLSAKKSELLTNDEVIAVDQDGYRAGDRVAVDEKGNQVWSKNMQNGDITFLFFNPHNFEHADIAVSFDDVPGIAAGTVLSLRDLWQKKELGQFSSSFVAERVPPHGVQMVRAKLLQ